MSFFDNRTLAERPQASVRARRTPATSGEILRCAQDDSGPAQDDSGPAQDDSGPAQDDSGPAQDDSGPAQDDIGQRLMDA
jgi:hypothetical protein